MAQFFLYYWPLIFLCSNAAAGCELFIPPLPTCVGNLATFTCTVFDSNVESYPDATYWQVGDGENHCVLPHYASLNGHSRQCGPKNAFVATLAAHINNCFPSVLVVSADPSLNGTNVRCYVAKRNRTIGEGRLIAIGKVNFLPHMYVGYTIDSQSQID